MKNIIFVVVDALRADRLKFGGYHFELAPNINELVKSGLNFNQCYSTGYPTSVAFPSIWTSTMPLDYGGYTNGIYGRPKMLSEELQSHGYQTYGITTGHPSSSQYGYDRGFDIFIDLVDMYQWFRSKYITNFKDDIDSWINNNISDDAVCRAIKASYGKMLDDTMNLIDNMDQHNVYPNGNSAGNLYKACISEKRILEKNTMQVVYKLKQLQSDFSFAIGSPIVTKWIKIKLTYKNILRDFLNRKIFLISKRKLNSGRVVNNIVRGILKNKNKKPLFMYIHYFDLHEYKFLIPQMSFRRFIHLPRDILKVYKARGIKGGGFLYDLSLVNVDRHILELKKCISENIDNEEVTIVLTSDHGADSGLPFRPKGNTLENTFFDNFIHVPFVINDADMKPDERCKLVSHLDLSPSILDIAGVPAPSEMQGVSVINHKEVERDYVISESGGSGQCNVFNKEFYISIRSKKLKCIYIVNKFIPTERELYNLDLDPDELINLIDSDDFMEERESFNDIVIKRVEKIRSNPHK